MNNVLSFTCGPVATNCFLVGGQDSPLAFLIDAPHECMELVLNACKENGWSLSDVILTHTHWDHTADCGKLQAQTGARVFVHEADVYRLVNPMEHTIWPLPFTIDPVTEFVQVSGASGSIELCKGAFSLPWVHTPGHTEGSICIVDGPNDRLYAGDTLFAGSVGRTDLPGGDPELLFESIRERLFCLPESMTVYTGHGPNTTIGVERISNPFVGLYAS